MRRLLLIVVTACIAINSLWADVTSIADIVIGRGEWTEMHYPTEPQNTEAVVDTRSALSGDGKTLVELFPSANGGFGRLRVLRREGSFWEQLGQDIDGAEGAASLDWIIDTSRTGDRIAVRTQQYVDQDTGSSTQSLLLLEYQGGTWSHVLSYQAPAGHQAISTGDLTPDADVIAIGTSGDGVLSGEVRVFDIVDSQPQSTGGPQLVAKGDAIVGGALLGYAAVPSLDADGDTLAVSAVNIALFLGIPFPPAPTFKIFEFDGGETAGWRQVFAESDYRQWNGQGNIPTPWTGLSDDGTVLIFSNRGYSYPGSPGGYISPNNYSDSVSASGIIQRYERDQLAEGWGRVGKPIIGDQGDQLGIGQRGVSPGGNSLLVDTSRLPAQAVGERRRASVESVQLFGLTVPLPEGAVLNVPDHSKSAISDTQAAIGNTFQVVEWVGDGWAQKGESRSYAVVYQTPQADLQFCGNSAPASHLTDSADLVLVDVNCSWAGLSHTPGLYSFTTLTRPIVVKTDYGDGEVVLSVAVAADGGAAIITYDAFCSDGEQVFTGSSNTTRIVVSGLTNGATYTCTVTATNSVGTSPFSAATDPITPEETISGLPIWLLYQAYVASSSEGVTSGMPTDVTITRSAYDDGEIMLWVTADEGDSAVTRYDASCTDGTNTFTGTSTSSPITVSGLTNDVAYTCTVTATNSVGTSSASAATDPITPEETSTGLPIWLLYQATQ